MNNTIELTEIESNKLLNDVCDNTYECMPLIDEKLFIEDINSLLLDRYNKWKEEEKNRIIELIKYASINKFDDEYYDAEEFKVSLLRDLTPNQ